MIQLGAAFQSGLIPLKEESITQAININKWGAENNVKAFNLGRLAVHDPKNLIFKEREYINNDISINELKEMLSNYSKKSLKDFIEVESTLMKKNNLSKHSINTTLKEYARICLIKDEYRVANLHIKNYKKIIRKEFSSWNKVSFYLAPPILSFIKDNKTNNPKKFKIPAYIALPLFVIIDKISFLRNTPLDLFKYTKERQHDFEHKRIFEKRLDSVLMHSNESELSELVENSKKVRGYGSIKKSNLNSFKRYLSKNSINFIKI